MVPRYADHKQLNEKDLPHSSQNPPRRYPAPRSSDITHRGGVTREPNLTRASWAEKWASFPFEPLYDEYKTDVEILIVRTTIVIDDKLMEDTLRATGLKTKREAVEFGLRTLLRLEQQAEARKLRGKLPWEGGLKAMRTDK